jgi:hypothetical protein
VVQDFAGPSTVSSGFLGMIISASNVAIETSKLGSAILVCRLNLSRTIYSKNGQSPQMMVKIEQVINISPEN